MTPPPSPEQERRKIRALIVDDEPLARDKLRMLLERDKDVEIMGECIDGVSAISAIQKDRPDLLFLDVQMPGADGFEVLERVGVDQVGALIFVTAYDQHALRAFEFHALDYLLKPFGASRFQDAMARAKSQIYNQGSEVVRQQLISLLGHISSEPKLLKRLVVKTGGRVVFLRVEEIDWIEAAGNYVTLHVGSASHLIRQTMNALEANLNAQQFIRIHRSTIVNIERVKEMQPLFHGDFALILHSGTRLTLSRSYRDRIPDDPGSMI
ncbi:MAG TPA: LytTR family DNA-binding domain-containing protein [Bacteroidota bacterium]|nr:LytTR family DNA-binding domain-containing protein [Bacteroidota bacterium]